MNSKTDFLEHVQKTNIESQLKPCPFCGYNTPKFTRNSYNNGHTYNDILQAAADKWNERTGANNE